MGEPRNKTANSKFWIALIIVLGFLCYSNIYKNEFLFDDLVVIVENDAVKNFPNLSGIFLTPSYTSQNESDGFESYRPVTTLSFAANYALHGISPGGYHLVDVLIHITNSLIIYMLFSALFQRRLVAGIIAILFAVHPVNTEAVTGLFGRADTLGALFVLLGLFTYMKAWQFSSEKRILLLFVSAMCLVAGLASKESAACLILLMIVYEVCFNYFPLKKIRQADTRIIIGKIITLALFLFITFVYIFWWRPSVTGQFGDLVMADGIRPPGLLHNWPIIWRLTAFKAFAYYMKLLFWPLVLSGDYLYNQIPLTNQISDPLVFTGLILFLGFFCLGLLALIKGYKEIAFGILFFYAAFAPVSNLVIPIGALVGERLLYLPSLGFCIVIALLFEYLLNFLKRKTSIGKARAVVTTVFVVVIVAYGSRTFARNFDWKNPYIFFNKTSQTSPNSAVSHYSTAVAYLRMIEDSRFIKRWMNPKEAQKLREEKDKGRSLLIQSGLGSISKALIITEDYPNAKYLSIYGTLLAFSGRFEQAKSVLEDAIQRNRNLIEAKINLGVLYIRLASKSKEKGSKASTIKKGYLTESVKYLKEVEIQKAGLEEKPVRIAEVYFNLSIAQEKLGHYDEALENINNALLWLDTAIQRTGEGQFLQGRFYLIKANILMGKKDYDGAITALVKAKQSGFPQFRRYVTRMRQLRPLHKHPGFKKLIAQE